MKNTLIGKTILTSVAAVALCTTGQALAQDAYAGCAAGEYDAAVGGKIYNNSQIDSPFTTLGVAKLKGDLGNMKCALVGVVKNQNPWPQLPSFTHTISCDDRIEIPLPGGNSTVLHSQLTFDTDGRFTDAPSATGELPFIEFSTPRAESGRGVFTGATGGQLIITGTLNQATGVIDMEFSGEVCMAY